MENTKKKGHDKIVYLTELAVLIAIILIMGVFMPTLGFIKIGVLEISLITIPIAIGGMVMGPGAGAILGLVFGLASFYQCFGLSAFGAALLGINPFLTFIVCVPTRVLMGWLGALAFKGINKLDKKKTVSYFAGGLITPILNTIFFMAALVLCFYKTDYIQGIAASLNSANVFMFVIAMVGFNGVLEMFMGCVAGGGVSKALSKAASKF